MSSQCSFDTPDPETLNTVSYIPAYERTRIIDSDVCILNSSKHNNSFREREADLSCVADENETAVEVVCGLYGGHCRCGRSEALYRSRHFEISGSSLSQPQSAGGYRKPI